MLKTRKVRILLIDDDREDFIITKGLINQTATAMPYELEWVSDSQKALEELIKAEYDIYLLDYQLQDRDGLSILAEAQQAGCRKPIVLLTGQGDDRVDTLAMQMGAADYLPKDEMTNPLLMRTLRHALERSELLEKLHHQAVHDMLTGLYNRRYIMDRLTSSISAAHRHNHPLSLCLCDVDHFKGINDTHGHILGDEVLVHFAHAITKSIRTEDIAGRYGGDEFCIIFPHASTAEAAACTERIRQMISEIKIPTQSDAVISFTVTFGITGLQPDDNDLKHLIFKADKALYRAKGMGRNRTEHL